MRAVLMEYFLNLQSTPYRTLGFNTYRIHKKTKKDFFEFLCFYNVHIAHKFPLHSNALPVTQLLFAAKEYAVTGRTLKNLNCIKN